MPQELVHGIFQRLLHKHFIINTFKTLTLKSTAGREIYVVIGFSVGLEGSRKDRGVW